MRTYAHMCRDDHAEIGHNDSGENEMCPLCQEKAVSDRLRSEITALKKVVEAARLAPALIDAYEPRKRLKDALSSLEAR